MFGFFRGIFVVLFYSNNNNIIYEGIPHTKKEKEKESEDEKKVLKNKSFISVIHFFGWNRISIKSINSRFLWMSLSQGGIYKELSSIKVGKLFEIILYEKIHANRKSRRKISTQSLF